MRTLMITSIPSPYRVTVFDALHGLLPGFEVLYLAERHPAFNWNTTTLHHRHTFVNDAVSGSKSLMSLLKDINPDIVITCGFNKSMLQAMFYAFTRRKKLVANTDAWELNERSYSLLHRLIRRLLYPRMSAMLPVSRKGFDNFRRYGIPPEKIFISHYAIDNTYSLQFAQSPKRYDLMFSGQFIDRKMPDFFCDVVIRVAAVRNNLRVLLIGDGELREATLDKLRRHGIDYTYGGFVQKEELPAHYASARLFLFPTRLDSWGVVANDACAVGTPVITCDAAGAAGDLVLDGYNGLVLPIDAELWSKKVLELLANVSEQERLSRNCLERIQHYAPAEAAQAVVAMTQYLIPA